MKVNRTMFQIRWDFVAGRVTNVANPKIQPRLGGTCGCRLKALASAVESQYTVIENTWFTG